MVTFEEYVRLRGERLVRLARVLVRDPHLAEDLVQEVLAKAFVRWNRIVNGAALWSYTAQVSSLS